MRSFLDISGTVPEGVSATSITALLHNWQEGDVTAYDRVIDWAYDRMVAIASSCAARERLSTEPGSLVHEAYLRLRQLDRMQWRDRSHFISFVAQQLRRIVVDHARKRLAEKREGTRTRVPLAEDLFWVDASGEDLLDLDAALEELQRMDAEKAELIDLRYFMGCTVPEIAELRGISDASVERHLRFARTWLHAKLNEAV